MSKEILRYPGLNLGHEHAEDAGIETLIFGFWAFLMSDAILFGMVFVTYVTSLDGMADAPGPESLYDIGSIFIQTLLLLASSFTYGMASLALKYHQARAILVSWLSVTLLLGLGFLVLEVRDLIHMAAAGGLPSQSGFLSAFWDLVPLHGIHVAGGMLWMLAILLQMSIYGIDAQVKSGLLRLGLFWHFLDIIWIGIFSIVYLAGLA